MEEQKVLGSKSRMELASLTFALGVFGNTLAIAWLVWDKRRKRYLQSTFRKVPDSSKSKKRISFLPRTKSEASEMTTRYRVKEKLGHFRTLLLTLLCVDLTGTLVISPVTLHLYHNGVNITESDNGNALCRYSAFAMMFFGIATMALLTTMAVDRSLSIQFPFWYRSEVTAKRTRVLIACILLFCATLCSLPPAGVFRVKEMFPGTWCFADWYSDDSKDMAFSFLYASLGLILIFTTVICNSISLIAIGRLKIRKRKIYPPSGCAENETQNIIQVTIITCIYVICWSPLVIRALVNPIAELQNGNLDRTAIWLATVHPILDPWVYILFRNWVLKLAIETAKRICLPCFLGTRDGHATSSSDIGQESEDGTVHNASDWEHSSPCIIENHPNSSGERTQSQKI